MVTIPLYIFLIIFFLFLIVFGLFFLINIGHLFQTAALTFASVLVAILLISASLLVLWGAWYMLSDVNWQQSVTIFDTAWFGNLLSFTNFQ